MTPEIRHEMFKVLEELEPRVEKAWDECMEADKKAEPFLQEQKRTTAIWANLNSELAAFKKVLGLE